MKKSILITMLCILGLAATAQTYDTIYNRAANGYYYHWYDTCEDFHTAYSLINLSYTPNDTSRISCVSHYTPEPMMITGGIIWVSDEMYTRPGSRYGWLHDYRPYPEYIMLYQYDAWRDRMVFVDSARWDTATPKIMKLPLGPNPDRTGYTYCYGYEAHFKNPVMVDTTFVMGGTHNNVYEFDDFLFRYRPFYYCIMVNTSLGNCLSDTTWQYSARLGWHMIPLYSSGYYGGVIPTVDTFRLEVATNDSIHGSVSGSGTFANMSWHTIAAYATPGYRFSHWNDGNRNNPRQIQIRQDTTFTAFFVERGEVWADVRSNNEDFGTTTGGGMYYEDDTATLTATPMPLHKFLYWNDSVTDNPRYVELTQDTLFTALFAPLDRYSVEAGDNNTGRGHVEGGGIYYEGDTVTLTALPWMTFRFLQWDDGIRDNPRSFVVTQDTVFNALFVSQDGIEEAESGGEGFQLSPNPTTGNVRCALYSLPTHGGTLTVLDALGQEVLRQKVEPCVWSAILPTSHLPQGVYYVTLTTAEKTCTQKLVVK